MRWLLYIAASAMLVVLAFWAYHTNYATQAAERRADLLRTAIAEERATIAMLRAEWAYLNRPDRLRDLAERHFATLRLMPLDAAHYGEARDLPYPPDEALPLLTGEAQSPMLADELRRLVDTARQTASQ